MRSEALVQLSLEALGCTQKELATRLGVSATQISKWKKGEHLSFEMEEKLRGLSGIGDQDPEFIIWSGSRENALKWERLIHYLAEMAQSSEETGYDSPPLEEDNDLLCWNTFHTLREMGVEIPEVFPAELEISAKKNEEDDEEYWEAVINNPHSSLIHKIFKAFTDVYGFYTAYVEYLINDDTDLFDSPAEEIEPNLISLAASKVDVNPEFATNFRRFKYKTERDYEYWIGLVKDRAFKTGTPLKAELLNLVYNGHYGLGHAAEAESLGFNASRIHPDVYMNELLIGMRVIHQVLPAILKKLGIEDEFQLDEKELRIY
ncbi:helix-turn-helix transcriptional regulator [Pseudomonas cichorii]|uniref:helix-turn-helix domain-containing protein n=1 Tax=Pseudomonas cichorii TaxID=36746 RepID=UPI001C8AEC0F|nr:helix-turn-helix transcriptional regulator [Pseudomonas cichorii]MBX8517059.1 helix-turn-helix transcriptional regulator [Pseudomonas cichorii]